MAGERVPGGVLNKAQATVVFDQYRQLNITPDYLTEEGVSCEPQEEVAKILPNMNSITPSVSLKLRTKLTISLNRAQSKVEIWKEQIANWAVLGKATITPDSSTEAPITLYNLTITKKPTEHFNGSSNVWTVELEGYEPINAQAYTAN